MTTMAEIRQAFPEGQMGGERWVTRCILPGHADHNPSLAISIQGSKLLVACTCGRQNELFAAVAARLAKNGPKPSELVNTSTPLTNTEATTQTGWQYSAEKVQAAAKRIDEAEKFLASRGISPEVARKHHLGFESIGGKGYLVIPTFFEGNLVCCKLRALRPISKNDKWKKWDRDKGVFYLYNREAAENVTILETVYIVESELDALTAESHGILAVSVDTAKHKLNDRDAVLLRNVVNQSSLVFAPDSDNAGLQCAVGIAADLSIANTVSIEWPGKDLGELYAANPEEFREKFDGLKSRPLWRRKFHALDELGEGEPRQLIKQVLPEGVTFFGSLSGVCKTWIALAMSKALTTGEKFLGIWDVPQKRNVLYLCPEMGERSIRTRGTKLGLPMHDGFFCQTISDGAIALNDPLLFQAIRDLDGPVVFLDTAIRFSGAESENNSSENASGLAMLVFALLREGAIAVVCLHHSKKTQGDSNLMTLENVLRGTGDCGAMADCVWGIQHARKRKGNSNWDDTYIEESKQLTRAYLACVKPRDLPAADPFIVQGRPYIDETGNLVVIAQDAQVGETMDACTVSDSAAEKAIKFVRENPAISKSKLAQETGVSRNRIEEVLEARGWRYVEPEVNGKAGRWEETPEAILSPQGGFDEPF